MRSWQGFISFLLGCALIYLFWPFLVWLIAAALILIAFWLFRLWQSSRAVKKQWEEAQSQFEIHDEPQDDWGSSRDSRQNDDVIDVEYTERRIDDDRR